MPRLSPYCALRAAFTSQETMSKISNVALTSGQPRCFVLTSLSQAVRISLASAARLRLQSPALKVLPTFTQTWKVSCSTTPFSVLTSNVLMLTLMADSRVRRDDNIRALILYLACTTAVQTSASVSPQIFSMCKVCSASQVSRVIPKSAAMVRTASRRAYGMSAAALRSLGTGTGQGEGKRESLASKRAPGFLRIMRPVSRQRPQLLCPTPVPRTSQSPKGRTVCQSVRILIIVRLGSLIPAPLPEPKRNGDPGAPGKQPESPRVSLMASAGSSL